MFNIEGIPKMILSRMLCQMKNVRLREVRFPRSREMLGELHP